MSNNAKIGARIKEIRRERGLPQEALAKRLGLGIAAISKKERGDDVTTAEQLAKLSVLLDCSADYFLQDIE